MSRWSMVVAIGFAAATCGCAETVAKRAFSEAAGASAKVVSRAAVPALTDIDGLKVGEIRNSAENLCPAEYVSALRRELETAAKASKVFVGSASMATVHADVVHYESAGTLEAAMAPETASFVLVTLAGADGKELAKLTVVGRSAAARTGPADVAKAMAARLIAYLEACKTGDPTGGVTDAASKLIKK